MSAYLTFTILGRRSRSREGSDEVSITIRAISRPDEETATWLLRERYPSAEVTDVVTNAGQRYRYPITAASLATVPVRRQARATRRSKA